MAAHAQRGRFHHCRSCLLAPHLWVWHYSRMAAMLGALSTGSHMATKSDRPDDEAGENSSGDSRAFSEQSDETGLMRSLVEALAPKVAQMFAQDDPESAALRQALKRAEQAQKKADKLDKRMRDLEKVGEQLASMRDRREWRQAVREEQKIQQGVKASVETVPMPVRLEVSQTKLLKLLATLSGTTSSAIIRDCIAARIEEKLATDQTFRQAAESSGLL